MKKFLALIMVLVLSISMLSACDTPPPTENPGGEKPSEEDSPSSTEQVLFDDENVKVTFMEIFEMDGIPNNCYLRLNVENKSDKTVMVSLKDSYVNDTAQMMGTGVPIVLAPGKNSQQAFFFGYGNLGITSKDEIEKIEFKVWLIDDDTNDTVVETESLVVDFTK
jgi:hypothetical protein